MKRSEKTENAGKPFSPGAATEPEAPEPTDEQPKRSRRPRAGRKQEEMKSAQGTVGEDKDGIAETVEESGTESEMVGRTGCFMDAEAGQEMRKEAATEMEPVSGTDDVEQAGTSPVIASEACTVATSVPFPTVSTQIVESPLKRMKQEFQQRAQVIRDQMRNIQNAFITIGFQLYWIRENNMFRVLNYKNIYDYAEKEYGIKRTTCCNFICIIENYAERDENGDVIESIADCYRNYSASQLVAMLGMPEEMKQQVTPDMSVRKINRLRKGESEVPVVSESSSVLKEESMPEKEGPGAFSAEEAPTPDNEVHTEERLEMAGMPEADRHAGKDCEMPADNMVSGELSAVIDAAETEPESTEMAEAETTVDGGMAGQPEETGHADGDTLAEIDSYNDYQSMADELDLIMRHVFSAGAAVRVRIVCVQG